MKLSELIDQLGQLDKRFGDLPVKVQMPDGSGSHEVSSLDFDEFPVADSDHLKGKKVKQITLHLHKYV